MDVKRYVSDSVAEGLMTVRQELGKDAMILSVDERPNGGGKVEIVAKAATQEAPQPDTAIGPGMTRRDAENLLAEIYQAQGLNPEEVPSALNQTAKTATKRRPAARKPSPRKAAPRPTPKPEVESEPEMTFSDDELDSFLEPDEAPPRRTQSNARTQRTVDPIGMGPGFAPLPGFEGAQNFPPEAASLFFYLRETGVEQDIAHEMIERLCTKYDPNRGWNRTKIRDFLGQLVKREVRTAGVLRNVRKKRIVSLIGPTGVGKTTTIAKIATKLVRNGTSVGMITVDHFRVGAVDQLRKFADTVRVPLLAASNRKEFQSALRAFSARQVVLVDTAGQNPRDVDLLKQLDRTLNVAENHERHLVLSAPTKERDLGAFIELYQMIDFDYLLFSKLDETATYGGLLNAYFIGDRPFSYFTTGQRVPEDIEEASSDRLNDLLFN